jgi:hypothetical protein
LKSYDFKEFVVFRFANISPNALPKTLLNVVITSLSCQRDR